MRIIFWGNGNRGVSCLKALYGQGDRIELVVTDPEQGGQKNLSVAGLAQELGISTIGPENPNDGQVSQVVQSLSPDVFILAGYGKILGRNLLRVPNIMSVNLHAGKLPKYRGSSPMNWALINGDKRFTLSIIKVAAGVDTGDILLERTFNIGIDDTIRDLHLIANEQFPEMLLDVMSQIKNGTYASVHQDGAQASYYPLRFPADGLILWDVYRAEQIHNRIRALTDPYPGAFTYFQGTKVKLPASQLNEYDFFGEPGRVYQKSSKRGLLVCALDKCLWVKEAVFADSQESLFDHIRRYDMLATMRWSVVGNHDSSLGG